MHRAYFLILLVLSILSFTPACALQLELPEQDADKITLSNEILSLFESSEKSRTTGTVKAVLAYHSPAPDAFNLPDGRIFISSGLLREVKSADELAFIIAHELAHLSLASHSHTEEDADLAAIEQLQRAGFQATAAVELLERCSNTSLRTLRMRPALLSRVEKLQQALVDKNANNYVALNSAPIKRAPANKFY